MKSLLDIYHENGGQKPLFAEIIDIDFYDGPTEAICQLMGTDQWFVCSLVHLEFNSRQRIFTVLKVSNTVMLEVRSLIENRPPDQEYFFEQLKEQVKAVYTSYSGKVFLFKSSSLSDIQYEVVELASKELQYFEDIEMVLEQSKESKLRWLNFFSPAK